MLNTWFVAMLNAAQTLVTNGVSTSEDVDRSYMIVNRGVSMGPMGIMDVVGMKTAFDVINHWGHVNNDQQMIRNGEYIKANFVDQGKMGLLCGQGYYSYPNPAYQRYDFLAVPDKSVVAGIVRRTKPS